LVEKSGVGAYSTLSLKTACLIKNIKINVQQSKGTDSYKNADYTVTGRNEGENTIDLRFYMPSAEAYIKPEFYVDPMKRDVTYFISVNGAALRDAEKLALFGKEPPKEEPVPQEKPVSAAAQAPAGQTSKTSSFAPSLSASPSPSAAPGVSPEPEAFKEPAGIVEFTPEPSGTPDGAAGKPENGQNGRVWPALLILAGIVAVGFVCQFILKKRIK
jgi:hypothetical protein